MNKLIGVAMISVPFAGVLYMLVSVMGVREMLITLGIVGVCTALFYFGLKRLHGE